MVPLLGLGTATIGAGLIYEGSVSSSQSSIRTTSTSDSTREAEAAAMAAVSPQSAVAPTSYASNSYVGQASLLDGVRRMIF
jgi:hypothetical protein